MLIPFWQRVCTHLNASYPTFFSRLGLLESYLYQKELASIKITAPIFITGLARAGSSILLNLLFQNTQLSSFTYQDYPFLQTPILWRHFRRFSGLNRTRKAIERIHKDRIKINTLSPESFDEILWKSFFPHLHESPHSDILSQSDRLDAFDQFYQESIKKILYLNSNNRFVCKNNYHFSRFEYVRSLFPDAHFIFLYRTPSSHIASLMKQHTLLSQTHQNHPATLQQFNHLCHFEFGQNRRTLSLLEPTLESTISKLWSEGQDIKGWALYWDMIYRYILTLIDQYPSHIHLVHYETMCQQSETTLNALYSFLNLSFSDDMLSDQSAMLGLPTYYKTKFSAAEQDMIQSLTNDTFQHLNNINPLKNLISLNKSYDKN